MEPFDPIATNWHYPRQDLALNLLDGFERRGQRAYLLFERRRMGKTQFLQNDLAPSARNRGWRVLYVSFWSREAVAPELRLIHGLEALIAPHPAGRKGRPRIRKAGAFGFSAELEQAKAVRTESPLLYMEDVIERLCRTQPLLLLLDEFQAIARHGDCTDFLKELRTSLDKRDRRIGAVFTGSSMLGLSQIFEHRDGPLYKFAPRISFPPFDEDFVRHCIAAFEAASQRALDFDDAWSLFERVDRVTGPFRHVLESMVLDPRLTIDEAARRAEQDFSDDQAFNDVWIKLDPEAQALLAILATVGKPFSEASRQRMGELTGAQEAPSTSRVQVVRDTLVTANLIVKDGRTWRLADPEFARWVSLAIE